MMTLTFGWSSTQIKMKTLKILIKMKTLKIYYKICLLILGKLKMNYLMLR
jgi:hypothetical protein